jgi:hypothetical protein
MTLSDLQSRLKRMDVTLLASREGKLALDMPGSAELNDELMAALKEHKSALLGMLTAAAPQPVHPAPLAPHPPVPPDRGWRRSIAYWPTAWRQRWREQAEARQADGEHPDAAEWIAFLATVETINEIESRGERIAFIELPDESGGAPSLAEGGPVPPPRPVVARALHPLAHPSTTRQGPRDFRKGDSWLPWHFGPCCRHGAGERT